MIGKLFAAVLGRWQLSLGILAAVVLALSLSYCKGRSDGAVIERAKWELAAAKAVEKARKADAGAADQRLADERTNTTADKERTDAIRANPDDPRRALNCQRLRQAGIDAAAAGC